MVSVPAFGQVNVGLAGLLCLLLDRGSPTTINVTCYDVTGPDGQLRPFEAFTLSRPRNDA